MRNASNPLTIGPLAGAEDLVFEGTGLMKLKIRILVCTPLNWYAVELMHT